MTEEVTQLWNRARQAHATAESLVAADPDASASRAYYAAFYAVSALFLLEEKSFSRHSALEAAVHRDLVKAGKWHKDLGTDYSTLLRVRATGDYGGHAHVGENDARNAVEAAGRILDAVATVSPAFR
jgi:uncharacterized protein (UPF0332 family)